MLHVASDMYVEYLRYTTRFRHNPYYIDALKPVERRLLLTLHDIAPNKLVKSARIVGDCIGKLHPHGDLSTYEALVGLVDRGFAQGSGNWGMPGFLEDDKAAAYRYSECMVQKGLDNIISEFLDFVEWGEYEYNKEPLHFSNPVPIGLIGKDFISGISVDVIKCPRYKSKDLFERLLSLLSGEMPKTIVPNIPGCDVVEDSPGEFERILKTGEGSIQVIPKIDVHKDLIVINGRAPLKGFGPLIAFNAKYKEDNKQEYFEFVDLCGTVNPIEVQVYPTKGRLITDEFRDTIWKRISQKVNVSATFINKSFVTETMGIDSMLLAAYNNWKETHLLKLNDSHRRCSAKIFELDVVQVVRDIMQYNPTFNKVDDVVKAFIKHQKSFPMITTENIRSVIGKYNIKSLIEKDLNQNEHKKELKGINHNISNLDKISLDRIKGYIK
jgi:DNA gyrase/topoisomerase IV subunit A